MTTVKSFRDLDVYQQSFDLTVKAHQATMKLPQYELYETGSPLRRAAKAIPANIAEGFGRRRYTQDHVRFLTYALASCDEVRVHLDMLHATGNMPDAVHQDLSEAYDTLGKRLNRFLQSVIRDHEEPYR